MPISRKAQSPKQDHRTRVAAERRERTRARLLAGALPVFAEHGMDAKVIDLVIRQAGVSRGTFYNYFRTSEELFTALAQEVSNQILAVVNPTVLRHEDPATRVACGVSASIRLGMDQPLLARFIVRGGPAALATGGRTTEVVLRDVRAGMACGRFTVADERLAFDLIVGPVIAAFHTVLTREVPADYPEALAQAVLQALGVEQAEARRCAFPERGEMTDHKHGGRMPSKQRAGPRS